MVAAEAPVAIAADQPSSSHLSRARRASILFVARRILKSIITLLLVMSLSFFLVRFMPGNPVQAYITKLVTVQHLSYQDARSRAAAMVAFNPNAPMLRQYLTYMWNLLHGNLGTSIASPGTTVVSQVFTYLPWTLFSVGLGLLLSFIIGAGFGLISAYLRGSAFDHVITNVASFIQAVPDFVWAMTILVVGGVTLGLFDVSAARGTYTPGVTIGFNLEFISDVLYHASLPILVYVMTSFGTWMLTMKSSTIQVLDEDFVMVAKARGLHEARVASLFVGRNAVLPLFAQLAIAVGSVVGGSVLIEQIFQYNGVGYYLYVSISQRDYPVMQGFILIMTVAVIAANLIADLLLSRIDPRIRTAGESES